MTKMREWLKKLKGKSATRPISAPADDQKSEGRNEPALNIVRINIGIDFGTSFTKACFRDVGSEDSGIVTLGADDETVGIIPSIVRVRPDGALLMGHDPASAQEGEIVFQYLKMSLAGTPLEDEADAASKLRLEHSPDDLTCVLSAWFLAKVLDQARNYIIRGEADRLLGREVIWSANVGVPVEYMDSPERVKFEEVLMVAWQWGIDREIPAMLEGAISAYKEDRAKTGNIADLHAVPEIAAAVYSFAASRNAQPGVYGYFDIGGGTVDGVVFQFRVFDGERKEDFLSGNVDKLGLEFFKRSNERGSADGVNPFLDRFHADLQKLVGKVMMTAKEKDPVSWEKDVRSSQGRRAYFNPLRPHEMRPFEVFLGGYGANEDWYRRAIESSYETRQHANAGIPPYKLIGVPTPADLKLGVGQEYGRFAIAYGLAVPYEEYPSIRLPSAFKKVERPLKKSAGVVDYMDTKDAYE